LFRNGTIKMRQTTIGLRDGRRLPIIKNATILYDENGEVTGAVETLTDLSELNSKEDQIEAFRRELCEKDSFQRIIGASPQMQSVFSLIAKAAQSDAPVIITGESGTGKELVTRAIHRLSGRKDGPMVKVNCAVLSETLLESELFGHVKGAFTGANSEREGRFEAAHGGYIFLDEIGDIPLSVQVKLLRVLEQKVIERVGSNAPVQVDARVISATNRDLHERMEAGDFRSDLFYRINVIPIHLPPLRERVDDITLLANAFIQNMKLKSGKDIEGISSEAMQLLRTYDWPGNVRELKTAFEYAFVACQDRLIEPHHLRPVLFEDNGNQRSSSHPQANCKEQKARQELIWALEKAGGNRTEAARLLGVSRVTVWSKMKRYNVTMHPYLQE
jgi:transcriptional regulator with PAS, ATPase and Fis domain